MKPPNHRTITVAEAVAQFGIERLLGDDFDDLIGDRLNEDDSCLVFDGATTCAGDLDLNRTQPVAFGEPWDRQRHGLIVVDGSLAIGQIDMRGVDGLLVLGDLICDSIHLCETLVFVQRGLVARNAVRATADKEWHENTAVTLGPLYVRVHGTVSSPVVETWCMPLRHLSWTADSGSEETLVLR